MDSLIVLSVSSIKELYHFQPMLDCHFIVHNSPQLFAHEMLSKVMKVTEANTRRQSSSVECCIERSQ